MRASLEELPEGVTGQVRHPGLDALERELKGHELTDQELEDIKVYALGNIALDNNVLVNPQSDSQHDVLADHNFDADHVKE